MKNKLTLLLAAGFLLTVSTAFTPASNWQISNKYTIRFTGSGEIGGVFKNMTGSITFDESNLNSSNFNLSIEVASINTGNVLMNTHAKGVDWFDAVKYPLIKFTSNKIIKDKSGYQVTGIMEIHGVAKEITLPFNFQNNGATGTFTGAFTVNRSDFHIGKPGGDIGEQIKLDISVSVVKK